MAQQGSRVGQHLGNYQLERLLGQGGFAEVYLGHHLRLQRQAAIKVLHAHLSAQEVEAFQREAQIIANLDHPNIVRIHDFDVQQGVPFLVMDYLPNGTLRQRHAKGERVPLPTVIAYVQQIADALQYAHDQKLIHRDVKPENMLIGRRNDIVLSDFGIAAIAHGTSSMTNQSTAGTIYYMAPEQIQSQARPASDQYALAVVVYEWLSGVRPFEGSYTEIFAKHLMTPPPPLRQHLPDLSPEVEQVIFTALAKEPGQRFSRVQAFATALDTASQAARPPAIWGTATRPTPQPVVTAVKEMVTASYVPPRPHPASPYIYRGHPDIVYAVAWSPDGTYIASGGDYGAVQVWNAANGDRIFSYRKHSNTVFSIAWSPNGKRIASSSYDNTVQVWNAADGSHVFTFKGHSNKVESVVWSPDGRHIASGSWDDTVKVWNATDGSHVFKYKGHADAVYSVAWSPHRTHIASSSDNVQVWNAADGSHVFKYKGHAAPVNSVAWSPDGRRIASSSDDQTVQVWNAADGSHVFKYKGHSDAVFSAAWSPDGTRIASGSYDNTVQVWNAVDGSHVFTYRGHADGVLSVAWSPDGTRIASGSDDKTVQVWTPQ